MSEGSGILENLVTACNEALDADNVFTGEGTLARRKIRDAVAEIEEMIEAHDLEVHLKGLDSVTADSPAKEKTPAPSTPPKQPGPGTPDSPRSSPSK